MVESTLMNLLPDMYVSGFLNGCVLSYVRERGVPVEDLPQHIVRETPERRELLSIVQVLLAGDHFRAAEEVYEALEDGIPPSKALSEELYEEYVEPFYEYPDNTVKQALQRVIITHVLIGDGKKAAQTLVEHIDFEFMEEMVSEFGDKPTSLQAAEIFNKLVTYSTNVLKEGLRS